MEKTIITKLRKLFLHSSTVPSRRVFPIGISRTTPKRGGEDRGHNYGLGL